MYRTLRQKGETPGDTAIEEASPGEAATEDLDFGSADGAPLRRSRALVLAISPASAASQRCRAELAAARALGRQVFPVWKAKV
eukprot:tig00000042_g15597.t1